MEPVRDTKTVRPVFGNYQYYLSNMGRINGYSCLRLSRKNLTTGEESAVLDNIASWTVHNDRIYYLEILSESIEIGPSAGTNPPMMLYDHFGGKLYSVDMNGNDKRLEIDAPNVYFRSLPSYGDPQLVGGRYMGIELRSFEETSDEERVGLEERPGLSMLILDTQTGEYKISVYEP
jgi:hypothetical protein